MKGKNKKSVSKIGGLPKYMLSDVIPKGDFDPLSTPVITHPVLENSFYINEIIEWLTGKMFGVSREAIDGNDTIMENDSIFVDPAAKYLTEKSVMNWEKEDFQREYTYEIKDFHFKSYPHYQFLTNILKAIEEYPSNFIEQYATRNSISKILEGEGFSGEMKCLDRCIKNLEGFLVNKNKQLIPVLYHTWQNGEIMSYDFDKASAIDVPLKNVKNVNVKRVFIFSFSRVTSDNFTKAIIDVLSNRIIMLAALTEENNSIKENKTEPLSKNSRERNQEFYDIIKQEWKDTDGKFNYGIPEMALLFYELNKAGLLNNGVPKNHVSLAIGMLAKYSPQEILNVYGKTEKDITLLFDSTTQDIIPLKLNRIISALREVIKSLEERRLKA